MTGHSHIWRALTTATPGRGPHIEVDSPLAGTRVRLHRDALVRLLAGKPVPTSLRDGLTSRGLLDSPEADREATDADLEYWQRHGWGLSLAPYLWSRSVRYHDSGPAEDVKRSEALAAMLRERPCPTPPRPAVCPITLPDPTGWQWPPLEQVLRQRRSTGGFRPKTIDQKTLGLLLHHGTAMIRSCRRIAASGEPKSLLVSVGSAFDIHLLVYSIQGLEPGAYRYDLEQHTLSPRKIGNLREEARRALAGQPDPTNATATILLVADFDRYQWRYRHERALRNLYIESGRLQQAMLLVATAMDLQTGITPAIRDGVIGDLIALGPGNSQAMHSLTV